MDLQIFTIRQKGTDNYMPARKNRRGFSHDKPEKNGGLHGPRIFTSRHGAKNAVTMWYKGIFKTTRYTDGQEVYDETTEIIPQPDRGKIDLEIVEYIVEEQKPIRRLITLNGFQAKDILDFVAPDGYVDENMRDDISIGIVTQDIEPQNGEQEGCKKGTLRMWFADYPNEGSTELKENHD